jgi:hypothetical protein
MVWTLDPPCHLAHRSENNKHETHERCEKKQSHASRLTGHRGVVVMPLAYALQLASPTRINEADGRGVWYAGPSVWALTAVMQVNALENFPRSLGGQPFVRSGRAHRHRSRVPAMAPSIRSRQFHWRNHGQKTYDPRKGCPVDACPRRHGQCRPSPSRCVCRTCSVGLDGPGPSADGRHGAEGHRCALRLLRRPLAGRSGSPPRHRALPDRRLWHGRSGFCGGRQDASLRRWISLAPALGSRHWQVAAGNQHWKLFHPRLRHGAQRQVHRCR